MEIGVGYHGCEETAGRWLAALPLPAEQVCTYAIPAGGGIPANWNAGVERARGRYLFIMGDDDAFAPGGLAAMLAAAEAGRGDLLAFERDIIDAESRPLPEITREHAAFLKGRAQGLQRIEMANAFPSPPFMSSLYRAMPPAHWPLPHVLAGPGCRTGGNRRISYRPAELLTRM